MKSYHIMQDDSDVSSSDIDSDFTDYAYYASPEVLSIIREEEDYLSYDREHGEYLLCTTIVQVVSDMYEDITFLQYDMLINTAISVSTFLKYDFKHVWEYANDYSFFPSDQIRHFDIVQYYDGNDREYSEKYPYIVVKTRYLKMFQRKYKKYFAKKMAKIERMKSPQEMYMRQIRGRRMLQ